MRLSRGEEATEGSRRKVTVEDTISSRGAMTGAWLMEGRQIITVERAVEKGWE